MYYVGIVTRNEFRDVHMQKFTVIVLYYLLHHLQPHARHTHTHTHTHCNLL